MRTSFDGWKLVYHGKQEEIASVICTMLWGYSNKASVKCMTDFIRVLRGHKDGKQLVWRGVGIDPTAKACKCWIEDLETVNRFRESVGVSAIG